MGIVGRLLLEMRCINSCGLVIGSEVISVLVVGVVDLMVVVMDVYESKLVDCCMVSVMLIVVVFCVKWRMNRLVLIVFVGRLVELGMRGLKFSLNFNWFVMLFLLGLVVVVLFVVVRFLVEVYLVKVMVFMGVL